MAVVKDVELSRFAAAGSLQRARHSARLSSNRTASFSYLFHSRWRFPANAGPVIDLRRLVSSQPKGACHDRTTSKNGRGIKATELLAQHNRGLHPLRRKIRPTF